MSPYVLYYAGRQFELPDANAALELIRKVETIKRGPVGGRLVVKLATGETLHVFVGRETPLAISGESEGLTGRSEPPPDLTDSTW